MPQIASQQLSLLLATEVEHFVANAVAAYLRSSCIRPVIASANAPVRPSMRQPRLFLLRFGISVGRMRIMGVRTLAIQHPFDGVGDTGGVAGDDEFMAVG